MAVKPLAQLARPRVDDRSGSTQGARQHEAAAAGHAVQPSADNHRVQLHRQAAGADCHAQRTPKGDSALHLAAAEDHGDVVALLLMRGAKVDVKDRWGCTPCDDCIPGSAAEKVLLKAGCCRTDMTHEGVHPIRFDGCHRVL